jgi:hypothetical protein
MLRDGYYTGCDRSIYDSILTDESVGQKKGVNCEVDRWGAAKVRFVCQ